jgi:succinate dehydrogenase / fumarate reductase membrane anchor subunit
MSLRSPLGRVLGSGSAKDGTGHWWAQRVTATALLLLGVWFLWSLRQIAGIDYLQFTSWVARPWNSVMLILWCVTLAWHSTLGLQVVIEDYLHAPFIKVLALLLNRFSHAVVAVAAVVAVMRISLGSAS